MRLLAIAFAASLFIGMVSIPRAAHAAPGGSYRDTCRDLRVYGDVLSAECRSGWGWRRSQLNYKRCYGDIANEGGFLVCRGNRGPFPPFGGGAYDNDDRYDGDRYDNDRNDGDRDYNYRRDWGSGGLVLFGGYGLRGEAFPTSGDVWNLGGTRFNDRARSVRIDRGVWQLCENANFGGRCITLDRSVTDLGRYGMNDAVSSVRRIR